MKNEVIIPELLNWTSVPTEVRILSLRKEALYREIVRERGIDALPGVREFLQTLKEHRVPCVIASSTHRENIHHHPRRARPRGFFRRHGPPLRT